MNKTLLIACLLLISCRPDKSINENYCDIINTLLKTELKDIDLLVLDTEPVILNDSFPEHNTITFPYLDLYAKKGFIKAEDILYIAEQAKNSMPILLDSTKFNVKTITKAKINNLFRSNGLDSTLKNFRKTGIVEIISFSSPLFTQDRSVIIFWSKIWVNETNAQGLFFIFKKGKGNWSIIERGGTFES